MTAVWSTEGINCLFSEARAATMNASIWGISTSVAGPPTKGTSSNHVDYFAASVQTRQVIMRHVPWPHTML